MTQQQQPNTDSGEDEVRERDLVEAYLGEHALETTLNDAINQVVADRPEDPFVVLSALLYSHATSKRGIFHVDVREVLDGTGAPTVLVRLHTGKGVFDGSCSSETQGLPDRLDAGDDDDVYATEPAVPLANQRFGGCGYRQRAANVALVLNEKLLAIEPTDQLAIDSALAALETDIGRNVCLAASVAACKAGARYAELSLVDYIAKLQDASSFEHLCIPMPLFSVVNAGRYASNKLYVQEVLIAPTSATSFADAYEIGAEFSRALRQQLERRGVGFANVGAFGGFTPQLETLAELFQILHAALDDVRSRVESRSSSSAVSGLAPASVTPLCVAFGVDFAASEFVLPVSTSSESDTISGSTRTLAGSATTKDDSSIATDSVQDVFSYNTDKWALGASGALKTSDEMLDITRSAINELAIATVVDPFDGDDVRSFAALLNAEHDDVNTSSDAAMNRLGGDPNCRVQVVGNALWERQGLETAVEERACNTVLLHLHAFPTLSRMLEAIADARRLGLAVIVGAVAGQSSDAAFLAALVVGAGIGQVKFGGLASADAIERYNELLLLSDVPNAPGFVADAYRR